MTAISEWLAYGGIVDWVKNLKTRRWKKEISSAAIWLAAMLPARAVNTTFGT